MEKNKTTLAPIIAIDFDGTLYKGVDVFPKYGEVRPYAQRSINFLYDIGVVICIWTCRTTQIGIDGRSVHDFITPVIEFMEKYDIKYDYINESYKCATFPCEPKKIFADMYVDDKGFGWKDSDTIFISILESFLRLLEIDRATIDHITNAILFEQPIHFSLYRECQKKILLTWGQNIRLKV